MSGPVDVVVIGLGAAGAFAARELAARGLRVVGLERHALLHDRGAYAGESRLFRAAYHEGTEYLPMLLDSRRRWFAAQTAGRRELFVETGALSIGAPDAPSMCNVLDSLEVAEVPHLTLDPGQLRIRYPQHGDITDEIGVLDRLGGTLRPESAVAEIQRQARIAGAELRPDHEVLALDESERDVAVHTSAGVLRASRVIVIAGVRTAGLVPTLASVLRIVPLALTWFAPADPADFAPEVFPAFIRDRGTEHVFGVPSLDGALVKAGWAASDDPIPTPEDLPARLDVRRLAEVAARVVAFLPALAAGIARQSLHMDVYTPDKRPLLGTVSPRTVVATGFSGHGFKLSPALGVAAAALAADEEPPYDLAPFAPGRFG